MASYATIPADVESEATLINMVFAPHVLMCEFADTDSDNVIESFTKSRPFHVDRRGKDHILAHTDPKHNMPEDTPTDA